MHLRETVHPLDQFADEVIVVLRSAIIPGIERGRLSFKRVELMQRARERRNRAPGPLDLARRRGGGEARERRVDRGEHARDRVLQVLRDLPCVDRGGGRRRSRLWRGLRRERRGCDVRQRLAWRAFGRYRRAPPRPAPLARGCSGW